MSWNNHSSNKHSLHFLNHNVLVVEVWNEIGLKMSCLIHPKWSLQSMLGNSTICEIQEYKIKFIVICALWGSRNLEIKHIYA